MPDSIRRLHAHARLLTAAVLAAVLLLPATPAAGTATAAAGTAAATAGNATATVGTVATGAAASTDHVDVPVDDWDRRELGATWSAATGTPLRVHEATTTLRVTLPPELAELDLLPEEYVLEARGWNADYDPGGPFGTWTYDGLTLDGLDVVVDMPVVMARLHESDAWEGVPPSQLRLLVRSTSWRADRIDLRAHIDLLQGPAPARSAITLDLPSAPALADRYDFTAAPVRATGGSTVVVDAVDGFWTEDPDAGVSTGWSAADGSFVADLTQDAVVSADGRAVTVTIPEHLVGGQWLSLTTRRGTSVRFHVRVPLIAPLTDPVEAYVDAVYRDLFGRVPDPEGLAGWGRALRGGTPYGAVSNGITYSAEFRAGLITASYERYLGRAPDRIGLGSWLQAMAAGTHIQDMESGFLASPEYYAASGSTDAGWVAAVYRDVLGRTPSSADVAAWTATVQRLGRRAVAREVLYSTEHLATEVDALYDWLLHRGIDPVGRRDWVRALQSGHRIEEIFAGIIASGEYRDHVPVG